MKVFNDGAIVDASLLRIPLNSITPALGLLIFESLRCYPKDGERETLYAFRLPDHYSRLTASLRALNVNVPLSCDDLKTAISMLLAANNMSDSCYIKILIYWDQEVKGTSLFDLST